MDDPAQELRQMIWGANKVQFVHVAAKLGIADILKGQSLPCEELAGKVNAHPRALYRYMRAASCLGLFEENDDGTFGLTPLSELLLSDVQGSQKESAIINGEEWTWRTLGSLLRSIETGTPAIELEFGMGLYEYFSKNPEVGARFDSWMSAASASEGPLIADIYDFTGINTVFDVAGGYGALLAAILNKYPAIHGVLAEQPPIFDEAKSFLTSEGVYDRCELISTNILHSIPPRGDLYIMKRVITAFDDSAAETILLNCRKVMKENARLLIADPIIPSDKNPHHSKVFDVTMLLIGGAFRTINEYQKLFKKTGIELSDTIETEGAITILICMPK